MDAYQVASTLVVIIAATAWLLRPRKPPIRAAADATQWRILATTLNCAEQSSVKALLGEEQKTSLETWLPRGADIYAVAVQECGCWAELRRTVEAHLGSAYTLVSYEKIGEKRVRGRIAVAVFARKCDVDEGLVEELTTKKMLMDVGSTGKGASTKGGVAIEVRVGARVLCFVGAHLPADAGGRAQHTLRNACAAALLGGDDFVELQERCHVFFLGDLNYRAVPHDLTHARDSTLKRVAYASSKQSRVAWAAATRDDELIQDRRSGRALCGFREAPIYFAPTFRRVPGVALPGRDADAAALCDAYTLFKSNEGAATVEEALALARRKRQPPAQAASAAGLRYPSWTDRVLVASPPADDAALELLAYDAPEFPLQSDHRPARLRCALSRKPPAETYAGALRVTLEELCFEPSSDDDAAELDRLVRGLVPDAPASRKNRVAVSLGAATASAPWAARAVSVEAERAPRHCVVALEFGSALVALPTRDWGRRFREPVVRFGRSRGVLAGRLRVEASFSSGV